jgi:shikimate dehydrogenase
MKAGVLGGALRHSISPELHQALWPIIASMFGREEAITFSKFGCASASDVLILLPRLFNNGFDGINVTFPYKELVAGLAIETTEVVKFTTSSNCLSLLESPLAHSTDGAGLIAALKKEWGPDLVLPNHWVVYGAGGAARAVVQAMMSIELPKQIVLVVRDSLQSSSRIETFKRMVEASGFESVMKICNFGARLQTLTTPRLHVQTTPLGQVGQDNWPGGICPITTEDSVIDLVYNPQDTSIMNEAKKNGARAFSGLGMLIEQAALSQVFWIDRIVRANSPLTASDYFDLKQRMSKLLSPN